MGEDPTVIEESWRDVAGDASLAGDRAGQHDDPPQFYRVLLSLSAVAWSICLVRVRGLARAAGIVGLICGITPLALHAAEHLRMNVPGFSLFVQVHAVWAFFAGVVLARGSTDSLTHTATEDVLR